MAEDKAYTIKLEAFEGPMDLLMHLIEKDKIDIYDIPIADLTRQYLAYLERMREFNIEIASSFLVMAATLLKIKSQLMLPKQEEEQEEEADPREELVRRLLEYRQFKEMGNMLGEIAMEQERYVVRPPMPLPVQLLPPVHLSVNRLVRALQMVLTIKEELKIPEALVTPETYNIQDKVQHILSLLEKHDGCILFIEAFHSGARAEIIVTFLALLELIKLRTVKVSQKHLFDAIYIETRSINE